MLMQSRKKRRWTIAGIITAIVGVLGTLIVMAAGGVIGNRANDAFGWFLDVLHGVSPSLLPWIIVLVVILACGGVVCWLVTVIVRSHHEISDQEQRNSVLNHAFTTQHIIILLDDSLLRLLASWIPSKDHENEMKSILAELLSDASAAFNGHVHRAFVTAQVRWGLAKGRETQ